MKRVFLCCICLLCVLVSALFVSDVLNKWFICRAVSSSTYKTYRLFIEKPQDEIPLIGSSRALGNFVPSLMSPKVFDYGINGSRLYETLFMLREILKGTEDGPILVNFDPWGVEGEYKPFLRGDYRLALKSLDVRMEVPYKLVDRIPGIRFHGMMRNNIAMYIEGIRPVTKKIDRGAALLVNSRSENEWKIINNRIDKKTFECDQSWKTEIERIARDAKRNVIWIVGPCSPQWRRMYDGREKLNEFLSWLETLPNMRVINLFDETADWGEEWFADPTHLNVKGAERFTKLLMENLRL